MLWSKVERVDETFCRVACSLFFRCFAVKIASSGQKSMNAML